MLLTSAPADKVKPVELTAVTPPLGFDASIAVPSVYDLTVNPLTASPTQELYALLLDLIMKKSVWYRS